MAPGVVEDVKGLKEAARVAGVEEAKRQEEQAAPRMYRYLGELVPFGRLAMEPVAVMGIGCRFPQAGSAEELLTVLKEGRDCITEIPRDRIALDAYYNADRAAPGRFCTRYGGFMDALDQFDPQLFGLNPREAAAMDPQQRLVLEASWRALEHAGLPKEAVAASRTGVYVGQMNNDWGLMLMRQPASIDPMVGTGASYCITSNRVSYVFDLRGPSMTLDTACSSSLVAMHLACVALRAGECSRALAGGVNMFMLPEPLIGLAKLGIMTASGRCRTFDAAADGYARGEGVGMVALALLKDVRPGDPVLAVVRASAVNQDGHSAQPMTSPSFTAQQEVLRAAYSAAGCSPLDLQYVECHGTGTVRGDTIETTSLGTTLRDAMVEAGLMDAPPVHIGSIKSNFGHCESAAGVASFIKVVLGLSTATLFPTLHVKSPNPQIPWAELPLQVQTEVEEWPTAPAGQRRLAGINSFGFGGTNCHMIIEEAPPRPVLPCASPPSTSKDVLFPLSADSSAALQAYAAVLRAGLEPWLDSACASPPSVLDLAYTASCRRSQLEHRAVFLVRSLADLAGHLTALASTGSSHNKPTAFFGVVSGEEAELNTALAGGGVSATTGGQDGGAAAPWGDGTSGICAYLFSGQGPQWWAMGRDLLAQEPVFALTVEEIDALFTPLAGWSLSEQFRVAKAQSRVEETQVAQPMIFALQVGLATLWRSWGVLPTAVVGHSVGEVAAALVSGCLTLTQAVRVIYHRAKLQHDLSKPGGRMLAVELTQEAAQAKLSAWRAEDRCSVAAVNGPSMITIAGDADVLEKFSSEAKAAGTFNRFLQVPAAFHSPHMDAIEAPLLSALGDIVPSAPRLPLFSTVWGEEVDPDNEAQCAYGSAKYWWLNVRKPVLFDGALQALLGVSDEEGGGAGGAKSVLELAPHPVLSSLVAQSLQSVGGGGEPKSLFSLKRGEPERKTMLAALAQLHVAGHVVNWDAVCGGGPAGGRAFTPLPPYPFQTQSLWAETEESRLLRLGGSRHPLLGHLERGPVARWRSIIDLRSQWWLRDHAVLGSVLMPGAAFVELALASASELGLGADAAPLVLRAFEVTAPLVLPTRQGVVAELMITAKPLEGGTSGAAVGLFEWTCHGTTRTLSGGAASYSNGLALRPGEDDAVASPARWTLHARATLVAPALHPPWVSQPPSLLDSANSPPPWAQDTPSAGDVDDDGEGGEDDEPQAPLAEGDPGYSDEQNESAILGHFKQDRLAASTYYSFLDSIGFQYGPQFQALQALWRGVRGGALSLRAPAEDVVDAPPGQTYSDFILHPAMLDAVTQGVSAVLPSSWTDGGGAGDGSAVQMFLPDRIDELAVYRSPPASCFGLVEINSSPAQVASTSVLSANFELIEKSTQSRLVVVRNYRFRQVKQDSLNALQRRLWYSQSFVPASLRELKNSPRRLLVIVDHSASQEAATAWGVEHGVPVRVVLVGEAVFESAAALAGWLATSYLEAEPLPTHVVFAPAVDLHYKSGDVSGAELMQAGWEHIYALITLFQALNHVPGGGKSFQDRYAGTPLFQLVVACRGEQSIGTTALPEGQEPMGEASLAQSTLWGFCRSARIEMPEVELTLVDLPQLVEPSRDWGCLLDAMGRLPAEEVLLRGEEVLVGEVGPTTWEALTGGAEGAPPTPAAPSAGECFLSWAASSASSYEFALVESSSPVASDAIQAGEVLVKPLHILWDLTPSDLATVAQALVSHLQPPTDTGDSEPLSPFAPATSLAGRYGLGTVDKVAPGSRLHPGDLVAYIASHPRCSTALATSLTVQESLILTVTSSPADWLQSPAQHPGLVLSAGLLLRLAQWGSKDGADEEEEGGALLILGASPLTAVVVALAQALNPGPVLILAQDAASRSALLAACPGTLPADHVVVHGVASLPEDASRWLTHSLHPLDVVLDLGILSSGPSPLLEALPLHPFSRVVSLVTPTASTFTPPRLPCALLKASPADLISKRPKHTAALIQSTATLLASLPASSLPRLPSPSQRRPLAQAGALTTAQNQALLTGYAVVDITPADRAAPHRSAPFLVDPRGLFLVVGGTRGLGLATAVALVRYCGVKHVALMGRSVEEDTSPSPDSELGAALRAGLRGASVMLLRGDAAVSSDVDRCLDRLTGGPPLMGVFYPAMVMENRVVLQSSRDQLERVLRPKALGAWNIHAGLTRRSADFSSVRHFVMYSSILALLGVSAQSSYSAANHFLDQLALFRRQRDLPGLAPQFGALAGVGYVARHDLDAATAGRGFPSMEAGYTLRWLMQLLGVGDAMPVGSVTLAYFAIADWGRYAPSLKTMRRFQPLFKLVERQQQGGGGGAGTSTVSLLDRLQALAGGGKEAQEERQALLEGAVQDQLAAMTGLPKDSFDLSTPLPYIGMDSMLAVELRNWVSAELKLEVSLFAFTRSWGISELVGDLLNRIDGAPVDDQPEDTDQLAMQQQQNQEPAAGVERGEPGAAPGDAVALQWTPEQQDHLQALCPIDKVVQAMLDPPAATAEPPRMLLLVFPHLLAHKDDFTAWVSRLPAWILSFWVALPMSELHGLQPPISALLRVLSGTIDQLLLLHNLPIAMYGHDFGAFQAFELTRHLQAQDPGRVRHLVMGAAAFPQADGPYSKYAPDALYRIPDPLLLAQLRAQKRLPKRYRQNPRRIRRNLGLIRYGFKAMRLYDFDAKTKIGAGTTVTCMGGQQDSLSLQSLQQWKEMVEGPFSTQMYQGDHFFVESEGDSLASAMTALLEG